MIILSLALLFSGGLLGTGITLACMRRRADRIQQESWNAARLFYTRMNSGQ